MRRWRMYAAYAVRSLQRAGQRGVLAVFCVAIGVMAIVALQLVGVSVNQALISNIAIANGGDIRVVAIGLLPLHQSDLAYLDGLRAGGQITDYAATYEAEGDVTLADGSDVTFNLIAVSPGFPLLGDANFTAPASDLHVRDVVQGRNAALNREVAAKLHVGVGDSVTIKLRDGRSVAVTVAALFQTGGAFFTNDVLISQAVLNAAPGPAGTPLPAAYTTVYVTAPAGNVVAVAAALRRQYPIARVITVQDLLRQRLQQVDQIRLFLRLVGLLALFIGGVGIVNTMQVLLRRRTIEIAVLKTSGYQQRDLIALFGLEAALIGLLGGMAGTLAGIGASNVVRLVVQRAFFLQLPIILDPGTLASGVAVGLATAVIFGLLPIIQASRVRPLAVLREYAEGVTAPSRFANAGLLALLSLLFVGLATAILGNPLVAVLAVYGGALVVGGLGLCLGVLIAGIARLPVYERPSWRFARWLALALGVLAGGSLLAGLLVAAGVALAGGGSIIGQAALALIGGAGLMMLSLAFVYALTTVLDGLAMFAPRPWKTALMLAYRNLGRSRGRTTATLTALFVGIFGIGLVVVLGQGIKDTITTTIADLSQYNVFVLVPPAQADATQQALTATPALAPQTLTVSSLGAVRPVALGNFSGADLILQLHKTDDLSELTTIEGFDLATGRPLVTLQTGRNLGPQDAGTNDAVISGYLAMQPYHLLLGDTFTLASPDGQTTATLTIVGFYATGVTGDANLGGVLTDAGVADHLTGAARLTVFSLKIDPNSLPALRRQIVTQVPGAFVFSLVDLTALIDQILTNVIIMLSTIASLAMLAGLVIIANAVALAMLERRREIGILKSVGHTSGSILATVLLENGLIGFLGALVAMTLVVGAVLALGALQLHIAVPIDVPLVLGLLAAGVAVTVAVAAAVAWSAARVRPLEVLRYE